MFFTRQKSRMIDPSEALPGRESAIPTAERHYVSGNPLKGPYPAGLETAIFALGCYWGAERKFWQVPGVSVTAVGNAGGYSPNPSYEEVCSGLTGHAESVLVVFDPAKVSFEQLLKVFFESHDPTQGMRQGMVGVGMFHRPGRRRSVGYRVRRTIPCGCQSSADLQCMRIILIIKFQCKLPVNGPPTARVDRAQSPAYRSSPSPQAEKHESAEAPR